MGVIPKFTCGEEGPEFVGGKKHWLVTFDRVPHLMLERLTQLLESSITERDASVHDPPPPLCTFSSVVEPSISILAYLKRISRGAVCCATVFVFASIYLDRALRTKKLVITKLSVHRAVLSAVSTAAKFVDDDVMQDSVFAKVGGVTPFEFGRLERIFVGEVLEWKLFVSVEEMNNAAELLMPLRGGVAGYS